MAVCPLWLCLHVGFCVCVCVCVCVYAQSLSCVWLYASPYRLCGFPGGSEGKVSACNAGDLSSIPESGRSPREGNGSPLQYSCLENPMDRGAWWATQPMKWSEVAQSCPTLCDPMDCSLPGFSVHGIFQARVLEWVAISFSRGSSWPRDWTQVSCIAGRRFTLWATREAQLYLQRPFIPNK